MRQPKKVGVCGILRGAVLVCLPLFAACENATEPPVPSSLEAFDGESQSGVAGAALSVAPSVRVLDQRGRPMPGVRVSFTILEGEGHVEQPEPVSDDRGIASPGAWTLGARAGQNTLASTLPGVGAVTFTAIGAAGEPASIEIVAGQAQTGVVAATLAQTLEVVVRDANGNPVAGATVSFAAGLDGGAAAEASVVTDAAGRASSLWTLGTRAGRQSVTVTVGDLAAVFEATALPGEPESVAIVEGNGQSATVATAVDIPPAVIVRDAWGNAVPDVEMQFEVLPGSGKVDAALSSGAVADVATDSDGIARLARWVLGTRAGLNSLRATARGRSVTLNAMAHAGAPIAIQKVEGDGQSTPVSETVPIVPLVRVLDEFQNPVPGAAVTFAIMSGGGSIDVSAVATDSVGLASPGAWRMGTAAGTNALSAGVEGVATGVTFTATAVASSGSGGSGGSGGGTGGTGGGGGSMNGTYDLDVLLAGSISGTQAQEFYAAAGRWASVIAGDLPDVTLSIPANACGITHPAINQTVDDLIILVEVVPIDGPGNVLGAAGPCYIRSTGGLPVIGAMRLDEADVAFLESNGKLGDVVAHEIGHIIGVGTRWGTWLVGAGTGDPYFAGPGTVADFLGAGGSGYAGSPVPVENTGGPGTRDGHWRESIFQAELMTGWLDMGANPLSSITVSSLADIGYDVNMSGADAFSISITAAATAQGYAPAPGGFRVQDVALPITPIAVDSRGRRAPLTGFRR